MVFCISPAVAVTCDAGYYLDNATGTCKGCTGATYSDHAGTTECTACPTATVFKDRVTGYVYWTRHGLHDRVDGCRASFAVDDPRGDYDLSCAICDGDYGVSGNCSDTQCLATAPTNCIGGYYWTNKANSGGAFWASNFEEMKSTACIPVEAGYYSPDGDLSRTACPAGTSTIGYGAGADEAADCGVALHIGDVTLHLRSEKRTTHALHVRVGNLTFYGDMSTDSKGKVRVKIGDTIYSVYDDSI